MPDPIKPADGQPGTPPEGGSAEPPKEPPKPERTFTQTELDEIIRDRVKRAVPDDYEDLKALRATHDAAEEEKKTELQKAHEAAKKSEAEGKRAIAKANATLLRAALLAEASKAGAHDPDLVVMALSANDEITVDKDGNVAGAREAVAKLLAEKPFLAKGKTPGASGGEFGGNDGKTAVEKIAELEKKGDRDSLAEARRLKMAQHLAQTG